MKSFITFPCIIFLFFGVVSNFVLAKDKERQTREYEKMVVEKALERITRKELERAREQREREKIHTCERREVDRQRNTCELYEEGPRGQRRHRCEVIETVESHYQNVEFQIDCHVKDEVTRYVEVRLGPVPDDADNQQREQGAGKDAPARDASSEVALHKETPKPASPTIRARRYPREKSEHRAQCEKQQYHDDYNPRELRVASNQQSSIYQESKDPKEPRRHNTIDSLGVAQDDASLLIAHYDEMLQQQHERASAVQQAWCQRICDRKKALLISEEKGYAVHVWKGDISDNIAALLGRHQLNARTFFVCYGTDIQLQLQQELIAIFHMLAPGKPSSLTVQNPLFLNFIMQCADTAQGYNNQGIITHATSWLDYTWFLVDYLSNGVTTFFDEHPCLKAAGLGIIEGVERIVYNPGELLKDIGISVVGITFLQHTTVGLALTEAAAGLAMYVPQATGVMLACLACHSVYHRLQELPAITLQDVHKTAVFATETALRGVFGVVTLGAQEEAAVLVHAGVDKITGMLKQPCTRLLNATRSTIVRYLTQVSVEASPEVAAALLPELEGITQLAGLVSAGESATELSPTIVSLEEELVGQLPGCRSIPHATPPAVQQSSLGGLAGDTQPLVSTTVLASVGENCIQTHLADNPWLIPAFPESSVALLKENRFVLRKFFNEAHKNPSAYLLLADVEHEITDILISRGGKWVLSTASAEKLGIEAIDITEEFFSHVFGVEFISKGSGGIKFSGFHYDREGMIIKSGVLELVGSTKDIGQGVTEAAIKLLENRSLTKTFFSHRLSVEEIVTLAEEALTNIVRADLDKGKMVAIGEAANGMNIQFILEKTRLVSMYPVIQKKV